MRLLRKGSLGSNMCLGALATLLLSLPFLRPSAGDVGRLVLLGAGCALVLWVLTRSKLAGNDVRLRRTAAVVVMVTVGLTGLLTDGLGSSFSGMFTLVFVYVGLTCPARSTLRLLPVACCCWLATNAPLSGTVWSRLPVAIGIWTVIGELLAWKRDEARALRHALALEAGRDALTGLLNRHGLDGRLADLADGDAVVFLDLDHFKKVNDLFGHATGDAVLRDLGRVVLSVLRPGDIAVRYGGEELLLLLPRAGSSGADRVLDRLRAGWAASHPEMTFSAGVAVVSAAGGSAAVLRADAALYAAKAGGRNRAVHAETAVPDQVVLAQADSDGSALSPLP